MGASVAGEWLIKLVEDNGRPEDAAALRLASLEEQGVVVLHTEYRARIGADVVVGRAGAALHKPRPGRVHYIGIPLEVLAVGSVHKTPQLSIIFTMGCPTVLVAADQLHALRVLGCGGWFLLSRSPIPGSRPWGLSLGIYGEEPGEVEWV